MRYFSLSFALLLLAGCVENKPPSPSPSSPSTVSGEDVKRDVNQAAGTTAKYLEQKKEEYRRDMQEQMAKLDQDIERLKQRASEIQAESRPRWEKAMKELEEQREKARAKLEDLKDETPGAWEKFKDGADKAWNDLKSGYQKAAKEFEDDKEKSEKQ